ncbi:fasciclin domain-containing protein [Prevotella melaninogenica]|uniref:fasciclin domain-containing protein n=1 Tax=Prevotella melaninogenica TaxID=28132 RepID=UPI001BA6B845|nr:fasciclin domain-containing protein [Prevotella melaninogenica]QUB62359.1 fasciclin domain-containing protein [Prevotella melaninogenica]
MKKIIYIITMCLTMGVFSSCTQYNFDDTGLANGKHDMTMWEYFKGDSYNWDSLRVMAERADLVSLFQGTSQYGKNFTFFGPTNHSIRRYLYDNHMERVSDIPVADCKKFILNCVLPNKRVMLDDFKEGVKSSDASTPIGKGGETVEMASGKQLWIYTFHESYNGVPAAGPLRIHLVSPTTTKTSDVASCNIETNTGVVHSLVYDFNLTDF